MEPDDGPVPEPAGGVPVWLPEPLPMLGQFCLELEPEPEEVPEEPELVLPEPVLPEPVLPEPELPVLELDDGAVVDELLVEPVPELPVEVDVVAALATNAPPATRPEVSAPWPARCVGGSSLVVFPFISCGAPAHSGRHHTRCAPDLGATAEWGGRARGVI